MALKSELKALEPGVSMSEDRRKWMPQLKESKFSLPPGSQWTWWCHLHCRGCSLLSLLIQMLFSPRSNLTVRTDVLPAMGASLTAPSSKHKINHHNTASPTISHIDCARLHSTAPLCLSLTWAAGPTSEHCVLCSPEERGILNFLFLERSPRLGVQVKMDFALLSLLPRKRKKPK